MITESNYDKNRKQAFDAYFNNPVEVEKLYKKIKQIKIFYSALTITFFLLFISSFIINIPFIIVILSDAILIISIIIVRNKLKNLITKAKELGLPTNGKYTSLFQ